MWNPDKNDASSILGMLGFLLIAVGSIGSVLLLGPALIIGMSLMLLERGDPAGLIGVILTIVGVVVAVVVYQNNQILKKAAKIGGAS